MHNGHRTEDRIHTHHGDCEALAVAAGLLVGGQAVVRAASALLQTAALHEHRVRAERRPLAAELVGHPVGCGDGALFSEAHVLRDGAEREAAREERLVEHCRQALERAHQRLVHLRVHEARATHVARDAREVAHVRLRRAPLSPLIAIAAQSRHGHCEPREQLLFARAVARRRLISAKVGKPASTTHYCSIQKRNIVVDYEAYPAFSKLLRLTPSSVHRRAGGEVPTGTRVRHTNRKRTGLFAFSCTTGLSDSRLVTN